MSSGSPVPALDRLVAELRAEFARDPRGAGAAQLLTGYARAERDWSAFELFSSEGYTRNQVALERDFELLLLCWGAGQQSAIHNHEGQNCWMAVLEGAIEEVPYAWQPGELPRAGAVRSFARGGVAFIRDEIGLHRVRAPSASAGVSLHLYAKPFSECNVYCPDTGSVERRALGYHSIRGQRTASAGLAAPRRV